MPGDLPQALLDAYTKGARAITITPGTYTLPATGKNSIELKAWKDAAISANGVTIIFDELKHAPVLLDHCERVTLEGATLRFANPAFTQGRIKAMGQDASGKTIDCQIDAGYSLDLAGSSLDIADQNTRLIKVGTGDFGYRDMEEISPGVFRLYGVQGGVGSAAVNDWIFTRIKRGGSSVVHLDGCSHCIMRNVTLQNAGFGAFFDTGGEGGNTYAECTVMPGPKPEGATEEQLVGCGADGFHSAGNKIGPTIDHCSWKGLLHDDCIAIHGSLQKIVRTDGNRLILEKGNRGGFAAGEPVRISSDKGYFGEFNCVAVRPFREKVDYLQLTLPQAKNKTMQLLVRKTAMNNLAVGDPVNLPAGSGADDLICSDVKPVTREEEFLEVTLNRASEAPAGAKASNPLHNGSGYKILNCTMGNCRSRGILVKGDNGLIQGCVISGCGMSAISIGPEYWWGEADYSRHVVVKGNTLTANGVNGNSAVIFIHGDGALGNADISITGNTFDRNYGTPSIDVHDTDGLVIAGNNFIASPLPLPDGTRTLLKCKSSKNITLQGNQVKALSPGDSLVTIAADVTGVEEMTQAVLR
jgi:hypothetical protein